ncbi:MAG: hypothetical protein NZ959_06925 [Armatimonadetes bacterium]|nr:hypothetical protein [Armatimonadota bacterium]MDW8122323.1 hypothetical protein [Armatimonadota bacterium]
MSVQGKVERLPSKMQVHLMVEARRLPEVVEELTRAALEGAGLPTDDAELFEKVAQAIEGTLRKYVAAFQWCGFTVFCQESSPYDPWAVQAQAVEWAGD